MATRRSIRRPDGQPGALACPSESDAVDGGGLVGGVENLGWSCSSVLSPWWKLGPVPGVSVPQLG